VLLAALALLGLARRSLAQRRSQPEGELQAISVASVEQDPLAQLEVPTEADALARAQVLARAGRPAG
jgi:hypothetical protein